MPHLLVAISSHGFGHAMQAALVVNALRVRLPTLKVTLRTRVSPHFLASRLHGDFKLLPVSSDFGMSMHSAVDVDVAASAAAYTKFHADWSEKVAVEAKALAATQADLILADIPYLTLAGAQQAGIPAVALCSLNWADIYWHYCADQSNARQIYEQMQAAYQSARYFLQAEPSMQMRDLDNTLPIGPLASLGTNRRTTINQQLQLNPDQALVLIALGGIEMALPLQDWPKMPGVSWLVPRAWEIQGPEFYAWESLNLPFIDVLRSCDVVITKPGYGTFTEAACNGVAVLYLEREDWPETVYLEAWLKKQARALSISRPQLEQGAIMDSLKQVLAAPKREPPRANGAEQAAEILSLNFLATYCCYIPQLKSHQAA
jgi:hypothetical protein